MIALVASDVQHIVTTRKCVQRHAFQELNQRNVALVRGPRMLPKRDLREPSQQHSVPKFPIWYPLSFPEFAWQEELLASLSFWQAPGSKRPANPYPRRKRCRRSLTR